MDIDDSYSDNDTLSYEDLKGRFKSTFISSTTKDITKPGEYILQIASNSIRHDDLIAASLSNQSVVVCDAEKLVSSALLTKHDKPVTWVKFSTSNPKLIYTCGMDGFIYLWDLRKAESSPVLDFSNDGETEDGTTFKKPLQCFDVDLTDRLLCAGTEQIVEDAFVLFWDIRNHKLLGGYWETHSDDITQVAFHDEERSLLATTGLDGLVNVCDVSKSSEDEALLYCLNTEFPVGRMKWVSHNDNNKVISVASEENCIQLWDIEDGKPYLNCTREDLAKSMKRTSSDHCYAVEVHQDSDGLFLLCGSNCENSCLRTLSFRNSNLKPKSVFESDGKPFVGEEMVRSSLFNDERSTLLTGGEDGILRLWSLQK